MQYTPLYYLYFCTYQLSAGDSRIVKIKLDLISVPRLLCHTSVCLARAEEPPREKGDHSIISISVLDCFHDSISMRKYH